MTEAVFWMGSVNLAQLKDWDKAVLYRSGKPVTRRQLAGELLKNKFRCSLYTLQETTYGMSSYLAGFLGWGTEGQPCWRTDENRNTVMWDPAKWRDLDTLHVSLTDKAGDLGDEHFRSVVWALLEHRDTGVQLWAGSTHLSNGQDAGPERLVQAKVLVKKLPAGLVVLGADRNSLAESEPADAFNAAGLIDLTVGVSTSRTFPSWSTERDRKQIDAVHALGIKATLVEIVETGKATDHRGWKVRGTAPALTSQA